MRKVIAAMNMTIDGFCDHTAGIADDELHDHYTELLKGAGVILYGRKTYQLMEYWRTVLESPAGNKSEDDFAVVMDRVPKIVFSNTLKNVDWKSATVSNHSLQDEVNFLKGQPGKDIYVGSPSLIDQLSSLGLIDEYQLCMHPVILGKGLTLFKNQQEQIMLKLVNIKVFGSGAIIHYYHSVK